MFHDIRVKMGGQDIRSCHLGMKAQSSSPASDRRKAGFGRGVELAELAQRRGPGSAGSLQELDEEPTYRWGVVKMGERLDLVSGNTRLMVARALGIKPRVLLGSRSSINVAMDWTDFDADGQATIMLSLLTRHGRATPLLWLMQSRLDATSQVKGCRMAAWGLPASSKAPHAKAQR